MKFTIALSALSASTLVSAHVKMTNCTGNAGGEGFAMGLKFFDAGYKNSQDDTTVYNANDPYGQTKAGGFIVKERDIDEIVKFNKGKFPTVVAGTTISLIMRQLNADGAGPITCSLATDRELKNFKVIQTVLDMPGVDGNSNNENTDFNVECLIPAGTECNGIVNKHKNLCVVRALNSAKNGPFGGATFIRVKSGSQGSKDGKKGKDGNGNRFSNFRPRRSYEGLAAREEPAALEE